MTEDWKWDEIDEKAKKFVYPRRNGTKIEFLVHVIAYIVIIVKMKYNTVSTVRCCLTQMLWEYGIFKIPNVQQVSQPKCPNYLAVFGITVIS